MLPKDLAALPQRSSDSNKGNYGRVLVIAGSWGMAGAAALTCQAAYRAGAGLVYLACPADLYPILSVKLTETIIHPIEEKQSRFLTLLSLQTLLRHAANATVAAIGPGLGQDPETATLVQHLVKSLKIPMVIDADGLNAVARSSSCLFNAMAPWILTPHPGEMARLTGLSVEHIQANRQRIARETAQKYGGIVILKGHQTVVTHGQEAYVNTTGNPGLATGGTGDILTGIVAALVGQGLNPFDAARLGVYLHGAAGDLAAEKYGQISMIASDVLEWLPHAFEKYRALKQLAG